MINQDPRFCAAKHAYWLIMAILSITCSVTLLFGFHRYAIFIFALMAVATASLVAVRYYTRCVPIQEKKLQFFYKMKKKCVFSDGYIGREEIAERQHLQVNQSYVCDTTGRRVVSIKWPAPTQEELDEKRLMM